MECIPPVKNRGYFASSLVYKYHYKGNIHLRPMVGATGAGPIEGPVHDGMLRGWATALQFDAHRSRTACSARARGPNYLVTWRADGRGPDRFIGLRSIGRVGPRRWRLPK